MKFLTDNFLYIALMFVSGGMLLWPVLQRSRTGASVNPNGAIALMNQLVEGPLRDPASLNKPSTHPLAEAYKIGNIPGMDVHWGLAVGVIAELARAVSMREGSVAARAAEASPGVSN